MLFYFKLIFLSTILFFLAGCDSGDKKVYKKFDTSESYVDYSESLSDSKENGGYGFEGIAEKNGWVTNNSPNITGDSNAIKGDTLRFVAGTVFPNTLRAF